MKRKKPRNLRLLVQKDLESKGWIVGVVERQCGPVKRDLFGVADLLAYTEWYTSLVQVSASQHAEAHRIKLRAWWEGAGRERWRTADGDRGLCLALVDRANSITYEWF